MALRGKVSDLAETTHRLSELIEQLEQLMKGADVEIRCRSLIGRSRSVIHVDTPCKKFRGS
jgi:hypothetical protein